MYYRYSRGNVFFLLCTNVSISSFIQVHRNNMPKRAHVQSVIYHHRLVNSCCSSANKKKFKNIVIYLYFTLVKKCDYFFNLVTRTVHCTCE